MDVSENRFQNIVNLETLPLSLNWVIIHFKKMVFFHLQCLDLENGDENSCTIYLLGLSWGSNVSWKCSVKCKSLSHYQVFFSSKAVPDVVFNLILHVYSVWQWDTKPKTQLPPIFPFPQEWPLVLNPSHHSSCSILLNLHWPGVQSSYC